MQWRIAGDGTEISAGLGRPDHGDPLGRGRFGHFSRPNSRRMSSWGMPSPRASEAREQSSAAAVSGVISSSSTGAEASERESGLVITRSEERRVGKEWRARGWTYHEDR